MSSFKEVCFIGLGYIGLPTAAVVASSGIKVVGVDINKHVVDTINKGQIHIIEPNLEAIVKKVVETGMLRATSVPEIGDAYIVVVPTPFRHNYDPDISYVEIATASVIPLLKDGDLYILESTSPVGTTEKMAELIFSKRPELKGRIYITYCPERVLPGNVLFELANNDRVIGGIDKASTKKATEFYSKFVKGNLHETNSRTAEMCKLTENSSRDVQIAFANELSIICDKANIDVWELIDLANKHPRVKILQPGCGVGGHCIAVDPYFITSAFPNESRIIARARETNNYKSFWCSEKIQNEILKFELVHKRKPKVALMGLAFKPNIDDLRESPALHIVENIMQSAKCQFFIVEPNLQKHEKYNLTNPQTAYDQADIAVFLVAHNIFKTIKRLKSKIEIDFCGVLDR